MSKEEMIDKIADYVAGYPRFEESANEVAELIYDAFKEYYRVDVNDVSLEASTDTETLGQTLRFYRRLADCPQYDIAKRVGHSPGWLCLVEKDVLIPKPDDLTKLKNVLKIPISLKL